jgi:hypothetical protein
MAGVAETDVSAGSEAIGIKDKKWWGPRIWRILHSLAEVSDRIDCGPAWHAALTMTADILPCAKCRLHFHTHRRRMYFPLGKNPREQLRHDLWVAHTGTGGPLPETELSAEYGCGGDRGTVLRVAEGLIEEVFTAFRDAHMFDRFTAGRLVDWHRAMRTLASLLQTPLLAPPAPPPNRGAVGRLLARGAGHRRRM